MDILFTDERIAAVKRACLEWTAHAEEGEAACSVCNMTTTRLCHAVCFFCHHGRAYFYGTERGMVLSGALAATGGDVHIATCVLSFLNGALASEDRP